MKKTDPQLIGFGLPGSQTNKVRGVSITHLSSMKCSELFSAAAIVMAADGLWCRLYRKANGQGGNHAILL